MVKYHWYHLFTHYKKESGKRQNLSDDYRSEISQEDGEEDVIKTGEKRLEGTVVIPQVLGRITGTTLDYTTI